MHFMGINIIFVRITLFIVTMFFKRFKCNYVVFYKQVTLILQLYILDQHNLQLSSKTHTQKLYVDKTVKAYGPDFCYVRLNQKEV